MSARVSIGLAPGRGVTDANAAALAASAAIRAELDELLRQHEALRERIRELGLRRAQVERDAFAAYIESHVSE